MDLINKILKEVKLGQKSTKTDENLIHKLENIKIHPLRLEIRDTDIFRCPG